MRLPLGLIGVEQPLDTGRSDRRRGRHPLAAGKHHTVGAHLLTATPSRSSTPRSRSAPAAYSRSFGSNGASTSAVISTSTTRTRSGSTSG